MEKEKVKVSCFNCGVTNFYPLDAQGKSVVCGRCKTGLPEPGTVLEPGPQQVYNIIQNSSLPVLVDFYSPTCAPCYMMHPVVERLASRRRGEIMAVKVNIDRHPEMAQGLGITAVPTFIVFHKGVERGRQAGALAEDSFALWVASRS
jgi:thioredoxin 2